MLPVIDVSEFNRVTSWPQLSGQISGVIIRAGYRGWGNGRIVADARAREYLVHASARGLPIGLYFVSQAVAPAEAREEAAFCADMAKGVALRLPIFFDSELAGGAGGKGRADRISVEQRTACALAFVQTCAEYGHRGGVYCSDSWMTGFLDAQQLRAAGVPLWIASYPVTPTAAPVEPKNEWDLWQYTDHGALDGVAGSVDLSREREGVIAGRFSDTAGHWAEDDIDFIATEGIMTGKSAGQFAPNDLITRAELATALARMLRREREGY